MNLLTDIQEELTFALQVLIIALKEVKIRRRIKKFKMKKRKRIKKLLLWAKNAEYAWIILRILAIELLASSIVGILIVTIAFNSFLNVLPLNAPNAGSRSKIIAEQRCRQLTSLW